MKSVVVDASVVAAAFFQEPHAGAARLILSSKGPLCAPDLIVPDVANVIWKRHGRGEIDDSEARQLLTDILKLPLRLTPSSDLAEAALALALESGRTVYDCMYLALAVTLETAVVSADKRLFNALAKTPLAGHITWLGHDA